MESEIQSYRDLKVWQRSMALAKELYRLTQAFPREELYGLTCQVRRAAVSVPSNIAEGHARKSTREYLNHISIALGSLAEMETQIVLAAELGYLYSATPEQGRGGRQDASRPSEVAPGETAATAPLPLVPSNDGTLLSSRPRGSPVQIRMVRPLGLAGEPRDPACRLSWDRGWPR